MALAVLALAAVQCTSESTEVPPPPATLSAGATTLKISEGGKSVLLARDGVELMELKADAFMLGVVDALQDGQSYDPYWLEYAAPGTEAEQPSDLTWLTPEAISASSRDASRATIALVYRGLEARVSIEAASPDHFRLGFEPAEAPSGPRVAYVRVRLRSRGDEKEGFYGLGEWEDSVDHRGKLRPMQIEADGTIESSNNEAHVPVPFLIATRGWGVFAESKRVGAFDVARKEPALVEVTYGAPRLDLHLFADAPLDLTKHYYEVTGYPRIPAPWALGPWIWRDENRDQAQVLDDIAKIRALDLATSAIWIDRPYATAVNTFDFNAAQFPDPARMIEAAHEAGLRMALWSTPYLEKAAEPLRSTAEQNKYFPPKTSIPLNKWSDPIDLTNPAAYDFWSKNVHKYTDLGVEGFKLDYAEDVVPALRFGRNEWKFADGSDERTMHHGYTLLYHRVYADAVPKSGSYILARAGRWGDQVNVDVIWPGDMDATFTKHREKFKDRSGAEITGVGGLPATIVMGLSLGPSGFPFFGADTGGYRHSPPDKELFIRWFEQTALSTVMNVGDSSSQTPWEFTADNGRDQATLDLYRVYARLHMRLFPYEWTYAQRLRNDGRPIARPFGLVFPGLGHPNDEYMFGDELLVAPVVERGATSRAVIFPPGDWIDWWDGTVYAGGAAGATRTVPAPLDRLPLFLRRGGGVPMLRPTIDAIAPTTKPAAEVDSFGNQAGVLWTRLAPPLQPGERAGFEPWDGARVEAARVDGGLDLSTRDGSVFREGHVLELVGVAQPAALTLGGGTLARVDGLAALEAADRGWAWEPAMGGRLWVKLPPGERRVAVR
jgi:alpha-D-xyloside xylohydrolase